MRKKKILIIGSGVSGISAAYYLYKKYEIKIFEKNSYFGGHTHTHNLNIMGQNVNVDSGFIVFNNLNYKNFIQFIKNLNIKYQKSNMSFAVTDKTKKYEWSGKSLRSIFLCKNIFTLRYWRILRDIFIFNKITNNYMRVNNNLNITVSKFLKLNNFSKDFTNLYFYPMCASIWSNPIGKIESYNIHFILKFFANHGLINILKKRPVWFTISGGSKKYVEKIIKLIGNKNFIHDKVLKINTENKYLTTSSQKKYKYDHVIIATHTNEAKTLLNKKTEDQRKLLAMVSYKKNIAILHTDQRTMPKQKYNWSSWNFTNRKKNFALTYWMNLLQNLKIKKNIFVTINCIKFINKKKIIKKIIYSHPVFRNKIKDIKNQLIKTQGVNGIWFVGAWQGYGFHEDGIKSSIEVIKKIK